MLCPYCAFDNPEPAQRCAQCGSSLKAPQLEPGTRLGDQYQIRSVLGQGGFGITYLAVDTALEFEVAIKELFPEGSTRRGSRVVPPVGLDWPESQEKFLSEARVVQGFQHPSIVRVYGTLRENDTAYIVMEALRGSTLTHEVTANGPFPERTALEIGRQLCAALELVHGAGLLHRDIKPDNVFLADDGRAVLIDFGSARGFVRGQAQRHTRLVTPGYAAPEQYASEAMVGAYTDVYGLAATLYFAVEGIMPPAATERLLEDRLEFRRASRLRDALWQSMRLKIAERPASARALAETLQAARAPVAVPKRPKTSAAVSQAAPVRVVKGWSFNNLCLYNGMETLMYQELLTVSIEQVSYPVGQKDDVGWIGIGSGMFLVLISTVAGLMWLLAVGVFAIGIGLERLFRAVRTRPMLTKYSVWVRTLSGNKTLETFDNDADAMMLARAVRDHAQIPMHLP